MTHTKIITSALLLFIFSINCADDRPFLSGHIRRASSGVMTTCDPYNKGTLSTCVVYSSAFRQSLVVFNASAEELVLSPMGFFPLKVEVGPSTNELVAVSTSNKKFPYILGLDSTTKSIYPIRVFPSADGEKQSFTKPQPQQISGKPYRMAAFEGANNVFAILTNPKDSSINIVALDKSGGTLDTSLPPINIPLGSQPSHVQIDFETPRAIISDEGQNSIHILDLKNITNIMANPTGALIDTIDVGMRTDRIYLSKRDFGNGEKYYLAALKNQGNELKLINIDDKSVESSISLTEPPLAGYFPDKNSEPCCNNNNSWLTIASLKGELFYYTIQKNNGALELEKAEEVDLKSQKKLYVSNLHIRKILGGPVEVDSSLKREVVCKNNRKVFFVTSYGNQGRSYFSSDKSEVEAQGYSCEGESSARRLGMQAE